VEQVVEEGGEVEVKKAQGMAGALIPCSLQPAASNSLSTPPANQQSSLHSAHRAL